MIDKPLHPSIKYGKSTTSPLCDTLYELINNNNIVLHKESLKFEYFIESQKSELIQLFLILKKFIGKTKYELAELYINKHGTRIIIKRE